ncbi:MAG: 2-amino-4-hydroxy-6-hydroxymethyldihydropteridine diphosphokinase [Acinetobacter sp.]
MNANETIFFLAFASNLDSARHILCAIQTLAKLGTVQCSNVYEIPCRDGVGADYLNCACTFKSEMSLNDIQKLLQEMEQQAGRIRPSHQISLDIDLIAWSIQGSDLIFNTKKIPFALDVKIPMRELVNHIEFDHASVHYPKVYLAGLTSFQYGLSGIEKRIYA